MIRPLAILLTFISLNLHSQDFLSWKYSDRYFSLQLGVGSATYFGDITTKLRSNPAAYNLGYEVRLFSQVGARLEGSYYKIEGKDRWAEFGSFNQQRNHKFASENGEVNLQMIYYLKPYKGDYYARWRWDPYVGIGVGATSYNPYREYKGEKFYLRELATEADKKEYGSVAIVIPATAGIKFKVNDVMNLTFELGYRLAMTDYLDDVSGKYPNPNDTPDDLLLNDLANPKDLIQTVNTEAYQELVAGTKRGNNSNLDGYLFMMLKVEFYLARPFFFGSSK